MGLLRRRPPPEPELLGTVTAPSGDLLLVDVGLLRWWSGEQVPDEPGQDVEVVGPDARAAAAQVDLALLKGRWGFDLAPGDDLLAERVAATGLRAEVRPVDRVPHAERVRRLLADDPDGVEVPYDAGWAVAVRGVPSDRPLRVLGTRMPADGPDGGRWQSVWVETGPGEPVRSTEAGWVLVDEARLVWADPYALSAFRTDDPEDGLADVVLRGRDVGSLGVPALDAEEHGWLDLPVEQAAQRAQELAGRRTDEVRFAVDLRPHDDHHRLLEQMRASATGSGTVEVGGATMTGLFTSWGDGAFPVWRDLAADGSTVRVRVELGAPEIVARTRRFEQLWSGPLSELAFVSGRIARDGAPVGFLYREAPDRPGDSGWRVLAGDEPQEELDDPDSIVLLPLRELLDLDEQLEDLFASPAPAAYVRAPDGGFVRESP